jgi:hypothetical protein
VVGCKSTDQSGSMKMDSTNSSATTMPSGMTYTCTMHSDVVSNAPGKCPKCGMDLVAKK